MSLICPLDISCPQFPMLPALTLCYTFTTLTDLAPLAIKLHPTYTCNPHYHMLPGCHSLPYLSAPITCLLSPLIFIFFLITSHGTNIPISLSSFSSLSIPPSFNHPVCSYPHTQSPQTFPLSYLLYLPTLNRISQPRCHLPSYPGTTTHHVPLLSSFFSFSYSSLHTDQT